jgi:hypothetical protein
VSCWAEYVVLTGEMRNNYRNFVESSKKVVISFMRIEELHKKGILGRKNVVM